MEQYRKILVAILAVMALSAAIAIIDVSMTLQQGARTGRSVRHPAVGPGVGIVRIEGTISMVGQPSPFGVRAGAEGIIDRLDELEHDGNIKAVVVRINSPGGTVSATQEIYQKLWRLRKKNIILVASMGELAASGGYYVAAACNHIMANSGTITGSIGVISLAPNVRRLMERLGIEMNVIKSGRYKDFLSSFRELSPDEKALMQDIIDGSYRQFIKDIARGRSMSESDIEPWADGRIMSGTRALERKLIDGLGSFEEAVEKARELAKLPADAPRYDESSSPFQQFMMGMSALMQPRDLRSELQRRALEEQYHPIEYRYAQ